MLIKVVGGTAKDDKNLCLTCQHSKVAEDSKGEQLIGCSAFGMMMKTKIVKCTAWVDVSQVSLYDMKQEAWIIRAPTEKAGFRGTNNPKFKQYKKLSREEQRSVDDDTITYE